MLKLNINYLLKLNGINSSYSYLKKKGFSNHKIYKFVQDNIKQISIKDIERLCLLFKCTPNDLFDLEAEGIEQLSEDHPLRQIAKSPSVAITELTAGMTPEEIKIFTQKAAELKASIQNNQ